MRNEFDDLIKERKKQNQEIFESAFENISASVFGEANKNIPPLVAAIALVYKYYHIDIVDLPKVINSENTNELDQILAKHNLLTRKIKLEGEWRKENTELILVRTAKKKIPVILYPKGNDTYYYVHPETGEKRAVTKETAVKFEDHALTFYHPLPKKKLFVKDYLKYILKAIRFRDMFILLAFIGITTGLGILKPYLTRTLMGDVIINKDFGLFLSTALYMTGLCAGLLVIRLLQAIVNQRVVIRAQSTMFNITMMRLLSLPPSFFRKYNTGELTMRVLASRMFVNLVLNGIFLGGFSAIVGLFYLFQIAGFSASLILPTIGIVGANVIFLTISSFVEKKVTKREAILSSKESGVTYDIINGIQKIRVTGSENRAFEKWSGSYSPVARIRYNPPIFFKLIPVISAFITIGGSILIHFLVAKNNLDAATYIAFLSSYGSLSAAIIGLANVAMNYVKIRPLIEMINPILETEPENNDGREEVKNIEGNIKLDHVTFRYTKDGDKILDDLSLDIKAGEYVGIVGRTGCGKSTLVRLLLGFENPLSGDIYYDDKNINTLDLPSLRRQIGSVTQNGALFHATIRHNILISAPYLSEEDAWNAAKIAQIDKDIREMPMGMETMISEGQGGISGGQKQRITIARAIVHNPKILIFDEATSALDNQCQKGVTEAVGKLNCTRIVIAHRLSTIKDCDRIIYLEGGKVVEQGTYDELVKLNGRFKELIQRQMVE